MPSRRDTLAALGAGSFVVLAGCAGLTAPTGYVQMKIIDGMTTTERGPTRKSILRTSFGSDHTDGEIRAFVSDRWADGFSNPRRPTVSEELHQRITSAYDDVRYLVGVCTERWADDPDETHGCYNAETSREDFNRCQVYDTVRASYGDGSLDIHEVEGTWTFTEEPS